MVPLRLDGRDGDRLRRSQRDRARAGGVARAPTPVIGLSTTLVDSACQMRRRHGPDRGGRVDDQIVGLVVGVQADLEHVLAGARAEREARAQPVAREQRVGLGVEDAGSAGRAAAAGRAERGAHVRPGAPTRRAACRGWAWAGNRCRGCTASGGVPPPPSRAAAGCRRPPVALAAGPPPPSRRRCRCPPAGRLESTPRRQRERQKQRHESPRTPARSAHNVTFQGTGS